MQSRLSTFMRKRRSRRRSWSFNLPRRPPPLIVLQYRQAPLRRHHPASNLLHHPIRRRDNEHREAFLAMSDTWFPDVEFLLWDGLQENGFVPLPSAMECVARMPARMEQLHDTKTMQKKLDASNQTIMDLKVKQADMTLSITSMHTDVQRHKGTAAQLTQHCANIATAFKYQRLHLESRTTELKAACHVAQATNPSLFRIQGQVDTST